MGQRLLIYFFISLCCWMQFMSVSYGQDVQVMPDSTDALIDSLPVETVAGEGYVMEDADSTVVSRPVEDERHEGSPRQSTIEYRGFEFYLLLFILLAYGILRLLDESIYKNLFNKFLNTSQSVRHVKNLFQRLHITQFLLFFLFFIVSGIYIYYILDMLKMHPEVIQDFEKWQKILFYVCGMTIVYIIKLSFLRLVGYVFNLYSFTNEYSYNVMLVSQVLGIALYPFIWIIVFSSVFWAKVAVICSGILFFLAFLNRYARSRESISTLLKLNKFHFFIYLCTSEILPLLVIIKLITG